ncbi:MAG: signal peptidase I [Candidatus Curtissbacteria bacterium]
MSLKSFLVDTFREVAQTIVVSLAIFFFVYILLVQPHRVKGESMVPNFADGELLLTEKVTYRIYKPARGDVIVFKAPGPRNADFIKRIIGLPGENVKIENGTIFINDQKLNEPYETQQTQGSVNVKLEEGQYFVLGDNRASSSDSRVFGPIARNSITGRSWLVYWPIFKTEKSDGARIISRVDYEITNALNNR